MKYQWLVYGAWLGCGISPLLHADVLDDAGVRFEELFKFPRPAYGRPVPPAGNLFLGIPLSPEHEAELRAISAQTVDPFRRNGLLALLEARGDFAKALELGSGGEARPLDRARLLLRQGRRDEARAVFTEATVAALEVSPYLAFQQLRSATRPLEDAEDWETLAGYLDILLERLKSPVWQATVWREQTDVAWHRELLPALMESAAGDKLKLAIIHQRLGNEEECERLLADLTQGADARRMAGLLPLFQQSEAMREHALELWGKSGLAQEDRRALWPAMNALDSSFGLEFFQKWLREGGDAAPFADLVFKTWLMSYNDSPLRTACLEILQSRFPEDPRFQFLLGRQVVHADAARAAKLFEAAAASPLRKNGRSDAKILGDFHAMTALRGEELEMDPALLGFYGLGQLNRQDRIKDVIGRHAEWAGLSKVDQARYLALGGMDQDFFELVLGADPSLPENAGLMGWLVPVWKQRAETRVIPPAIYQRVVEKLPALVLGAEGKPAKTIPTDAGTLVGLLAAGPLEPEVVGPAVERLREAAAKRPEIEAKVLDRWIANAAAPYPKYEKLFPRTEDPEVRRSRDLHVASLTLQERLELLAPPEISRLAAGDVARPDQDYRAYRGEMFGDSVIRSLDRWPNDFPPGVRAMRKGDDAFGNLIRVFPAGHPRRLLVDVILTEGVVTVDEALKAESKAVVENLLAGKLKMRGTELFRFLTLATRSGDMKELRAILEEVKQQPPAFREKFIHATAYSGDSSRSAIAQLVTEVLGNPRRMALLQGREKPDEDVVKLQNLGRNDGEMTDEMIGLAGRILEKQLAEALKKEDFSSEDRNRNAQGTYLAVFSFDKAGRWKGWKDEATARMREAGRSELAILKFLRTLDGYASSSRKEAEEAATARRIFELDPTDKPAAQTLLKVAMENRDRSQLLVCIRALGVEVFGSYEARRLLTSFQKDGHGEFLAALESITPNDRMRLSREVVETLHGFFLSGGPEFATRFRTLLSERKLLDREMRVPLAKQLLDAGQQAAAVEWIAAAYIPARDYTGAPWAFPLIPGKEDGYRRYRGSSDNPETLRAELDFIRERQLLGPVIEFLDRGDSASSVEIVTLRLAAAPEPATFDRYALPVIEKMTSSGRSQRTQHWYQLFSGTPGASSLVLRIAAEELQGPGGSADAIAAMIMKVAAIPEGRGMIPELWRRLETQLTEAGENKSKAGVSQAQALLPVMLEEADDATWKSYWKWRTSTGATLAHLRTQYGTSGIGTFTKDARIRDLLPLAFGEFDGDKASPEQWKGWLDAILRSGDAEMLKRFRMMVPASDSSLAALCDLAEGKPDALMPIAGVQERGGDECSVWWNLATMPVKQGRESARAIPLASFQGLDGKFDVQILGAKEAGQFSVLRKIESVNTSGHVDLKLAEEIRQVAVIVMERGGAVLRWTPAIDRSPARREAADLSEAALLAKGFERTSLQGPGGLPAYRLRQSGGEAVSVAEIPWDGSSEVHAGVWSTGSGRLALSFLDSKGRSLREAMLVGAGHPLPGWNQGLFRGPGGASEIPSATERIVLSAGGKGFGEVDLGVSSMLLAKGDKPALPEGFERLGRLAGVASMVALSPDGKKLAIITQEGRAGLMDLASREIREFAPVDFDAGERRPRAFSRVLWAGRWLFAAEAGGSLYRIDPDTLQKTMVWEGDSQGYERAMEMRVTGDQQWLVWMKRPKTLLLMPVEGGQVRSIETEELVQFAIAAEGVRMRSSHDKKLLLKTADFAAGQPVEVETQDPGWERGWYEETKIPFKWEGRLRMQATTASRYREGNKEMVAIPATPAASAAAADGTLYYADRNGEIVRVIP